MRVKGDVKPTNKFTIEPQPQKPGFILVRFFENPHENLIETEDSSYIEWEYDEYHLELLDLGNMTADIESGYANYLTQAKGNEPVYSSVEIKDIKKQLAQLQEESSKLCSTYSTIESESELYTQILTASMLYVRNNTNITDSVAAKIPDLFITWDEALHDAKKLLNGTIINNKGQLYRVIQSEGVIPQADKAPYNDEMSAVYQPINS